MYIVVLLNLHTMHECIVECLLLVLQELQLVSQVL